MPSAARQSSYAFEKTHGFASLSRDRFAFIGAIGVSQKEQSHPIQVSYAAIKQLHTLFVNILLAKRCRCI
jgi:hypothetical protein